jgi:predicted transcriptional regulator
VHDTWAARDLPVLGATVALLEDSYMVTVADIAARTGLDEAAVARALEALDPGYLDFRKTTTGGDPKFWYVLKVTPDARRVVGQWPTAETLVDRMAEELSAAARADQNSEQQGLMAYAARLIGDTLRDPMVRVAGQVLGPALGDAALGASPRAGPQTDPPADTGDAPPDE